MGRQVVNLCGDKGFFTNCPPMSPPDDRVGARGFVMQWTYKVLAGLQMVRLAPGVQAKLATAAQLVRVATRSRLSGKHAQARPPAETVAANAWADYHLLSFVARPVNARVIDGRPPRLVAVIPELDPSVIFGGYLAFFQFLAFLQRRGVGVDLVVLKPPLAAHRLQEAFRASPLVQGVLSQATIAPLGVGRTVAIGALDAVLCYNWTTALVAAKLAQALHIPAYHYFIQEDERVFYPSDSHRFLAESIFHASPRPRLICNSAKLAEALLRDGLVDGTSEIAVFEQGIPDAPLPARSDLVARRVRRFVFYGRPEDHARRNLMTVALMALSRAVQNEAFAADPWEFYMIGSSRMGDQFSLGGITVTALPNCDYDSYRASLGQFDAGMALMSAPHPSVPPFEMVRSGIVTVVNTTIARPADWYLGISANFEPAQPTVDGLATAIARAVARTGNIKARLAAARTYHPADWEDSFRAMAGKLSHPLFQAALMDLGLPARARSAGPCPKASATDDVRKGQVPRKSRRSDPSTAMSPGHRSQD